MEDKLKEKCVVQKFFGEYSWMYKASAFLAFIMVIYLSLDIDLSKNFEITNKIKKLTNKAAF